jgi:hypothetical protein
LDGFYRTQGESQGLTGADLDDYVNGAIETLEEARTVEYHTLHETYGQIGNGASISDPADHDPNAYDSAFTYVADYDLTASFDAAAVGSDGQTIDLGVDVFETGQAVVFRQGGTGGVSGLVDGQIYYVIVDDLDSESFRLATTEALALSETADVSIGTVTGEGHSFSILGTFHATFGADAIEADHQTIDLGLHVLQNGQGVVYHSGGGTLALEGAATLTDGETYFVVIDPSNRAGPPGHGPDRPHRVHPHL